MEARNAWRLTDELHAPSGKGDPFAAAVRATRMPMVITDPQVQDNPIVFANDAFLKLTGYGRDEVIGRNCRFLQGPDTDPKTVRRIAEAENFRTDISVDILNYRKDGSTFWNALYMSPVSDEAGNLLFFFASQLDVTNRKNAELEANRGRDAFEQAVAARTRQLEDALEARTELLHEVEHRVKNNLQLVSALVFLEGRQAEDPASKRSFAVLKDRVDALAAVHRRLYREDDLVRFDLAQFIRDYATEVVAARGQDNVNLKLTLHELRVLASHAAPVALIASELIRQAVEQAQGPGGPQDLELTVTPVEHNICRLCVTSGDQDSFLDGIEDSSRRFVEMLARQLGGEVHWQGPADAAGRICIDIPLEARQGASHD